MFIFICQPVNLKKDENAKLRDTVADLAARLEVLEDQNAGYQLVGGTPPGLLALQRAAHPVAVQVQQQPQQAAGPPPGMAMRVTLQQQIPDPPTPRRCYYWKKQCSEDHCTVWVSNYTSFVLARSTLPTTVLNFHTIGLYYFIKHITVCPATMMWIIVAL